MYFARFLTYMIDYLSNPINLTIFGYGEKQITGHLICDGKSKFEEDELVFIKTKDGICVFPLNLITYISFSSNVEDKKIIGFINK